MKCYSPERVITTDVIIKGYEDPALELGREHHIQQS